MGYIDIDISSLHVDTEAVSPTSQLVYTFGRKDSPFFEFVPTSFTDQQGAAVISASSGGFSGWSGHLSSNHPAVWASLQASAAVAAAAQGVPVGAVLQRVFEADARQRQVSLLVD